MYTNIKEIRTPDKQLLIGMLSEKNNKLFLTIQNRGKVDHISIDALIMDIIEWNSLSQIHKDSF